VNLIISQDHLLTRHSCAVSNTFYSVCRVFGRDKTIWRVGESTNLVGDDDGTARVWACLRKELNPLIARCPWQSRGRTAGFPSVSTADCGPGTCSRRGPLRVRKAPSRNGWFDGLNYAG
jgi:hypothetical protein